MTKDEALAAMESGAKIKHKHFSDDEFMKKGSRNDIEFEDGCLCSYREFWSFRREESWNDGWSIFYE